MKTKECPSCAMNIEVANKECPICGYEFAETKMGYKWIAFLLILLFLFYLFAF